MRQIYISLLLCCVFLLIAESRLFSRVLLIAESPFLCFTDRRRLVSVPCVRLLGVVFLHRPYHHGGEGMWVGVGRLVAMVMVPCIIVLPSFIVVHSRRSHFF